MVLRARSSSHQLEKKNRQAWVGIGLHLELSEGVILRLNMPFFGGRTKDEGITKEKPMDVDALGSDGDTVTTYERTRIAKGWLISNAHSAYFEIVRARSNLASFIRPSTQTSI